MRTARIIVLATIAGSLVLGLVVDRADRSFEELPVPVASAVPHATTQGATWFCPGGSGGSGPARVGVEIINAGELGAEVVVTAMGSGPEIEAVATVVTVGPGLRSVVSLETLLPDDPWVGAVVEASDPNVLVSQIFDGPSGTDRVLCLTRTAESWIVPSGATRVESDGERMVLLILNPFPDDAVLEVAFDADVGLDSLSGVVAPARRVTAIDVTKEVTVAARVSVIIEVLSGRVAIERVQTYDSDTARGLSVEMATPAGSPVWYFPTVQISDGRADVLTVTNPSVDQIAQVDIEIIADLEIPLDPIELTVHPGRTVTVRLPDESRLVDLTAFSLVVRSLSATPIAASLDSTVSPGGESVVGAASISGSDIASTIWMLPMESIEARSSQIVVVNPSSVAVTRVSFSVIDSDGSHDVSTVELGPSRRLTISMADLGSTQSVVRVVSSSPVVVGSESAGLTSRSMSVGVRIGPAVEFSDLP